MHCGSLGNQAQGGGVSVCSEKVLDSRPGDHLPGTDVLTRHPFFALQVTIGSEMESFVRHAGVSGRTSRTSTRAEPAGYSADFWTEPSRAQDVADAVQRFNGKPKDGLKFMRARQLLEAELAPSNEGADPALLEHDARAIGTFLHHAKVSEALYSSHHRILINSIRIRIRTLSNYDFIIRIEF
jgi:hypothetical protein